jgi:O-antigen/teichoic acid export membrane protein
MPARPSTSDFFTDLTTRRWIPPALAFGIKLYAATAAAIVIYRFDVFLLNAYAGESEAGYYAVAIALTNALVVLPTALGSVLFPRLASLAQEPTDEPRSREVQEQAIRHSVLIVAVTSLLLAAGMPLLIVPVFGSEFEPAIEPAMILLPGAAALGLATTLYSALAGRGRPDYPLKIALLVTPLAIALYYVLIPEFESDGAALGSPCCSTRRGWNRWPLRRARRPGTRPPHGSRWAARPMPTRRRSRRRRPTARWRPWRPRIR